ncbi:MAG TPA: hypothetical protein VK464_16200 [Symbiobacteriaceae bacterium]|nr:hypothetical protein [Symbiobacteriaceae bacterium]
MAVIGPRQRGVAANEGEVGVMLEAAIEHLYEVFAKYRPQVPIAGCPCCTPEWEQERLNTIPLRELPSDLLEFYLGKAMSTWGVESDFKYLLPRLLEVFALPASGLDEYFLQVKLVDAGWSDWPRVEQDGVLAYFAALWPQAISTLTDYPDRLLDVLVSLTELRPYLERWWQLQSPAALLQLARFVYPPVTYATDRVTHWPGLEPFLRDPRTLTMLEDGCLANAGEEWAPELAEAADVLRAWLAQR